MKKVIHPIFIILVIIFGMIFYFLYPIISWKLMARKMRAPVYYQAAAKELAIYCQSVEKRIDDDYVGKFLYPRIFHELDPFYGYISPERGRVVIGGGFFPLGYYMNINERLSDEKNNIWDFYIYIGSDQEKLCTVKLAKDERISIDDMIQAAVQDIDRHIEQKPKLIDLYKAKIYYYLLFEKQALAYKACQETAERNPNDWWCRLTMAFIKAGKGEQDAAYKEFARWIENNQSYPHYFYLAYFCYLEGLDSEFSEAVIKALKCPLTSDGKYSIGLLKYFGWNMAVMVYEKDKHELAIEVCRFMEGSEHEEHGSIDFTVFKKALETNNSISARVWIKDHDIFYPYQPDHTDATQSLMIGKHLLPSEVGEEETQEVRDK